MSNGQIQSDRRVRRTKTDLKNAFIFLMGEKDYEEITVTDIVNRADYNRTTFYRHYQYKEELAEEIIQDKVNGIIHAFKQPYEKKNFIRLDLLSPSEIVIFDHIMKDREFYKLWHKFKAIPGFEKTIIESIAQFYKKEIVLTTPHDPELNNHLYTSFYANGILGIILDWIDCGLEPHPNCMAKQLVKILNYYPSESYLGFKEKDS